MKLHTNQPKQQHREDMRALDLAPWPQQYSRCPTAYRNQSQYAFQMQNSLQYFLEKNDTEVPYRLDHLYHLVL